MAGSDWHGVAYERSSVRPTDMAFCVYAELTFLVVICLLLCTFGPQSE
jgi:hypothetical protein